MKEKIFIEWYDAYSRDSWEAEDDAKENCSPMLPCRTVGWILNEDDDQITICHTYNPFQVMGSLHIPKCAIRRLKRFKG